MAWPDTEPARAGPDGNCLDPVSGPGEPEWTGQFGERRDQVLRLCQDLHGDMVGAGIEVLL
ncbi:hypothetical protein NIIDMKKI_62280 [Mycobacterium kansasii]|uniref:Uncharacterized protein n=1 Tax=Mycobacterium kansasii TaxID=1768 RepID=A0A7G1ILW8_MYCKA|nr:hypothetical protein NIIDMKKI_62280 [Mycobacterium kansasii]